MAGRQLTRYELEIMDVVWRLGEVTVHDVCANLSRPLAYTTVMTSLGILERKKGVLDRSKRGRAFVYRPRVSREEVSRDLLRDLRDVLFGGSLPSLVLNLMADESVSQEDIQALKDSLRDLEPKK
ncbi:MAG TPA: BlaI/MecI/CopY family transcriptional regulator [Pirellulales bacterium]|nr:BlaI/MecI/CopY family transcriptional regulator [Pirellulales bacterium]